MDRTGGLSLRADVANYSRTVKTGTWHLAREQEPKDYDISKGDLRNLTKSTYKRMATVTDGAFPPTTYEEMTKGSLNARDDYTERPPPQSMLSIQNISNEHQSLQRTLDALGVKTTVNEDSRVLPRPETSRHIMHLQSTQQADYQWRLPWAESTRQGKDCSPVDFIEAWKRCHSHFTDWDNHRRPGRNTWKDESGIYANSHLKAQIVQYQPTATIPAWN